MYGTVMIARMAEGVSMDDYDAATREWLSRRVDGFVDEEVMLTEDGRVVTAVRFRDKAAYDALAESAEQDAFYREKLAPMLAGEPDWIDGEWVAAYTAAAPA